MDLLASTTIRADAARVYDFWRDFTNLSRVMAHLEKVVVTAERTSHWTASAPFGQSVEWDAEITEDVPGERIAWTSVGKATVPNQGKVWFGAAPDGESTEVHVLIAYDLPGGALGKAAASYFGEEPNQQLDDDLRRFKQVMETGDIVRSDGAPYGKLARKEFPQRPAQPLADQEREEVLAS